MNRQILLTGQWGQQSYTTIGSNTTDDLVLEICFTNVWLPKEAKFRPCFLPVISGIPALLAAVILVIQILRLLITFRPRWSKAFNEEAHSLPFEIDPRRRKRWSASKLGLLLLSLIGLCFQLGVASQHAAIPRSYIPALSWLAVLFELLVYHKRTVPYAVLAIATFQFATQLIIVEEQLWVASPSDILRVCDLVTAGLAILVMINMPFRDPYLVSKDVSRPFTEPTSSLRSPEEALTVWQYMTVTWVSPLLSIGSQRQLQVEDVWLLPIEYQHRGLHDRFRELKGSVINRLVQANGIDLIILVVVGLIEQVNSYSGPILLQIILSTMSDPSIPKRVSMVYVVFVLISRLISLQLGVFLLWYGRRCYERSRGELITMLYEKTLNRKIALENPHEKDTVAGNGHANGHSEDAAQLKEHETRWKRFVAHFKRGKGPKQPVVKEPTSSGKLLNLMRNDVYEVAQRFWEFDGLVRKPVSVVLSVTLVVNYLGWSSLLGVSLIAIAQLLNALLARVMVFIEKKRRSATDKKLHIVGQFVESIRHLRWYGWQDTWLDKIMDARQKELVLRLTSSAVNISITFFTNLSLDVSNAVAFGAYVLITKKPLTVDVAFPALALFGMMTTHMREVPELIVTLINAWVAMGRIEDFMNEPDREDVANEALIGDQMAISHASFAWPGADRPVLKNIDLSFPEGMTVVYGEVASGKTAMLQALLGELDIMEGQLIRPHEAIGYCAQTPWLQSMSIRENILFSLPYDEVRYKAVIDACALTPDFAEFKAGDLSLIGENGIGLSGGQRARVALARAVYSRTKILLLDDPLSALDQQTAEAIVRRCFMGPLLQGRITVLITHRLDLVASMAVQLIKLSAGTASVIDREEATIEGLHRTVTEDKTKVPEDQAQKDVAVPDRFIEEEKRAHGAVMATVYWQYIKAGSLWLWVAAVFFQVSFRGAVTFNAWFLKTWGEAYGTQQVGNGPLILSEDLVSINSGLFDDYPSPTDDVRPWLLAYLFISIGESIAFTLGQATFLLIVYTAGKNMFRDIMRKVAYATFRFYDVTPVGRLMNRMTSDIGVIDGGIAQRFIMMSHMSIMWITAVTVIATITPPFLVFTVVMLTAFVLVFRRFIPTSQSLRRLEMVSLTPLISNFGDLINGLGTVRAFAAQERFQGRVIEVVDDFQKMDHFYWSVQTWLQWRFDFLSASSFFCFYVLALATGLSPGLTAFALSQANRFVQSTHGLCKQYGSLQMEFVSVERVIELLDVEQEPEGTVRPPAWWPSFGGDIRFENVTIKYADHMDPALSEVSFTVKGGSKTAILGRTGSGKSTLALSMLATILPSIGKISVDSVDLAEVDKQLLRTRITFLAQDPVLFPGSMRQNLDPVNQHTDEECTAVLQRVCERQGWSLDSTVEGGGRNLSQGQRQLVGLARAVLRRSAIIILDEATASIDRETAMQIQEVMHEEMKDSTVITIAHRLEAVKNADYCIVLGKGRVVEQGPAAEMLKSHGRDLKENADDDENDE